jgi:methylated-DNA-[protein]-cysteine S-methyltransferase
VRQRGSLVVPGWGTIQTIWQADKLLLLQLTESLLPGFAGAEKANDTPDPFLAEVQAQVGAFLAGRLQELDLPHILPQQPPFQALLLRAAQQVPYGQVLSYGGLAAKAGRPRAARAAGSAMANNTLFLLVPCHRVIAAGRRLGGYGGRPDLKRRLLALEGVTVTEEDRVMSSSINTDDLY